MDGAIQVCSPTFFPAIFDSMEVDPYHKETQLGSLVIWEKTIPPNSAVPIESTMSVNSQGIIEFLSAIFKSAFVSKGGDLIHTR